MLAPAQACLDRYFHHEKGSSPGRSDLPDAAVENCMPTKQHHNDESNSLPVLANSSSKS